MPPRTTSRRTRRTTTAASTDAGPAAAVVANLAALLDENRALRKEVDRLRGVLDRIASLSGGTAAVEIAASSPRRRGRPRRVEAAVDAAVAPAAKVRKPRRKITDPELLERRRAALAKARAVRAERLAASRQG